VAAEAMSLVLDRWKSELLCALLLQRRTMLEGSGMATKAASWLSNGTAGLSDQCSNGFHVVYISMFI
jgi:hypothetical protein